MNRAALKITSDLNAAMAANEAAENATPPSLKMYGIIDQLRLIDEALDESEGVLSPEMEAQLEEWDAAFDAKVDAVCRLRKNRLASADACKAEIERLQKRMESYQRGAESLRSFLFAAFTAAGKEKVKTASFTVYVKNGPLSVQVGDDANLPDRFLRFKAPEVDKKALLAAHEAGEQLPEGVLVGRKQFLEVR